MEIPPSHFWTGRVGWGAPRESSWLGQCSLESDLETHIDFLVYGRLVRHSLSLSSHAYVSEIWAETFEIVVVDGKLRIIYWYNIIDCLDLVFKDVV